MLQASSNAFDPSFLKMTIREVSVTYLRPTTNDQLVSEYVGEMEMVVVRKQRQCQRPTRFWGLRNLNIKRYPRDASVRLISMSSPTSGPRMGNSLLVSNISPAWTLLSNRKRRSKKGKEKEKEKKRRPRNSPLKEGPFRHVPTHQNRCASHRAYQAAFISEYPFPADHLTALGNWDDENSSQVFWKACSLIMGLFTGTSSIATRRANSAAPLKRRSLGRVNRDSSGSLLGPSSRGTTTIKPALPAEEGRPKSSERVHDDQVQTPAALSSAAALKASSQSGAEETSDEEPDLDLSDLQSDNTFLYERHLPLDSALGLKPLHPPKVSILERIDAYIAEHYLDCFGITHQDEEVQHHNRLVPFFAKAPRFLSIRSLKRKELERDYTKERDTTETCARKQLCLGRCLLGFTCPSQDLTSKQDSCVS